MTTIKQFCKGCENLGIHIKEDCVQHNGNGFLVSTTTIHINFDKLCESLGYSLPSLWKRFDCRSYFDFYIRRKSDTLICVYPWHIGKHTDKFITNVLAKANAKYRTMLQGG